MKKATEDPSSRIATLASAIDALLASEACFDPRVIQRMIRDAFPSGNWLPEAMCKSNEQGYVRHVLHSDAADRYTIAALVWRQGQHSPVHAHHTWCALSVVEGELLEEYFDYDAQGAAAVPAGSACRKVGEGSSGTAGLHLIHRVGNSQARTAISVHIYGVATSQMSYGINHVLPVAEAAIA
ncbi:cysteine dioxygenase family protein [Cupriavidus numazuensis]|uniref:Cysteine dioxygenase type I n=1 Tax=Cupriavidus numazuensis TaxID=221992 RepID=A0ABM8TEV3_9BURK|nr:cysteine dioxygenase family protein [Cupriavidus numazuensis]CAG2141434.1 hypothetical protein LMG26411_02055 [Cupriavidus numazuensis]